MSLRVVLAEKLEVWWGRGRCGAGVRKNQKGGGGRGREEANLSCHLLYAGTVLAIVLVIM